MSSCPLFTVHLFCLRKHLTPSIVAPWGRVMVDIRKSTAQQLGVYGSRFQWPAQWWSSVQQWCTVTCPRMQMLLLIFCQSSEEELAFRDKEPVFWSSGDFVQCASTTCSDYVSKQTIWRNIHFQNSCQSLRKNTLPLKNDCASGTEGGDYWAAGKSSHLQFFSPKNMCFEHEANSSNLRIQPRFIFCF